MRNLMIAEFVEFQMMHQTKKSKNTLNMKKTKRVKRQRNKNITPLRYGRAVLLYPNSNTNISTSRDRGAFIMSAMT